MPETRSQLPVTVSAAGAVDAQRAGGGASAAQVACVRGDARLPPDGPAA
jgi:hypothetical protein